MFVRAFVATDTPGLAGLPLVHPDPSQNLSALVRWEWRNRAEAARAVAALVSDSRQRPDTPWCFSRIKLDDSWRDVATRVAARVATELARV